MKPITVFYAGLVYEEFDLWPASEDMPDGAYLLSNNQGNWYVHKWGSWVSLNLVDVPLGLRTLVLLMS